MRKRGVRSYARVLLLAGIFAVMSAPVAFAVTSSSDNYQVTQTEFGSGSIDQTCSDQYCSQVSIGDLTSGDTFSANHTASFGTITDSDPLLEVIVEPGPSNFGVLSSTETATSTTSVKIRTYLSSGYMLQIVGDPPKYGDHILDSPSSPTASTPGTEQFGINLATNTNPSVGIDPVQVPSGHFSFGVVDDNYKIANQFMYSSGDTVAHSNTATGETDYTVSVIVNISNETPAGHYSGDYAAVVIPIY